MTMQSCRYRTRGAIFCLAVMFGIGSSTASEAVQHPGTDSPATDGSASDGNQDCNSGDLSCRGGDTDVGEAPDGIEPDSTVGNPINLMSGNKSQSEVDLLIPGSRLTLRRQYNSSNADANIGLGQGWHHSYGVSLFDIGDGALEIVQSNGARLRFEADGLDENGNTLTRGMRANHGYLILKNERHYWYLPDGRTLTFNGSYLVDIDWPDQSALKLYYRNKRLHSVTDETGRTLKFEYSSGGSAGKLDGYQSSRFNSAPGHLDHVVLPDGEEIYYDYDHHRNLTRVRFPDGSATEYHYEDRRYPNHLSSLSDRRGVRFAMWSYDAEGRAISSEHAGGVERVTLRYPEQSAITSGEPVQTILTNSLGLESTFTWQQMGSSAQPRLLSSSGPGCTTCPHTGISYSYDEQGRLVSAANTGAGNTKTPGGTSYRYDDNGRLTEIHRVDVTGISTLVEQRFYEGNASEPVRITLPSIASGQVKSTEFVYDEHRLPVAITETGFSPSVPRPAGAQLYSAQLESIAKGEIRYEPIQRTTTLNWDEGRLMTIDGPRSDVEDVTNFLWDEQQRLIGIQAPGSPAFTITGHDAMGRANRFQWGGRTPVEIIYDANGYLKESRQGKKVIRFKHDSQGRLLSITDQFKRTRTIAYDEAGRRVSVTDDVGHTLYNTYDSESRLSRQAQQDSDGTMVRVLSYLFDDSGELYRTVDQVTGALPESTQVLDLTVDPVTQDRSITDVESGLGITLSTDMVNRVLRYSDANQAVTRMLLNMDGKPRLTTDANGNSTLTLRDDFGSVVILASPDAGWVDYAYDVAGNRIGSTLADGTEVNFKFDAANRVIERDDGEGVTRWIWNEQSGRLSEASNLTASEFFEYDDDARLVRHARVMDDREFITGYEYDSAGRLLIKRLPDGQLLRYHYHENGSDRGLLRAITRQSLMGLREETLLADIDQQGSDGQMGYLSSNGLRTSQSLDRLGRTTHLEIGGQLALNYRFDASGRIKAMDNNGTEQTYHYKAGRLSAASTVLGNFTYRYDAAGNRTSRQIESPDGQMQYVSYQMPGSGAGNRLIGQTDLLGGAHEQYRYNESGAPTMSDDVSYVYDTQDRPVEVRRQDQRLASYQYNAFGERVKKTVYSSDGTPRITYFLYDGSTLSAEIDETGNVDSQYLYLEEHRPVVLLRNRQIYAIHADHQGIPRMMSDEAGRIVWQAEYTPFGKAELVRNEQTLNLRLAGQYADTETGTHYNYFRDYDPETGRYLSSDPMGLLAGLNTYAYLNGNPLGGIDPLGLFRDVNGVYLTTTTVAATATAWPWLSSIGAAIGAAVGTVTAPVWIAGGVVVGITAAAVAIYYHNGYNSDETQFANDFGSPPQQQFDDLLAQLMEYNPGLATTIEWNGTWEALLDLQQTLLDSQQQYVNDQNAILAQNPGGICLLPATQALYDQALNALEFARLGQQAAQDSMVGVIVDGVWFPSENAARSAQAQYDRSGTDLTFREWWAQVTAAHGPATMSQFSTINEINDTTGQTIGRDASSATLRANMTARGVTEPANHAAHHIVAGGSNNEDAERSRQILETFDIDVNEAVNGVYLPSCTRLACPPATTHSRVHTGDYYANVYARLQTAETAEEARAILRQIAEELAKGTLAF